MDHKIDNFTDGFSGEQFISQNTFEINAPKAKIYYLHGSWFIQINQKGEIRKLSFKNNTRTISTLFTENEQPFLILEDRAYVKKATIKGNPYLNLGYERLNQISDKLLIFGCSFKQDDHILEAIANNQNLKEIFITFIEKNVTWESDIRSKLGKKNIEFLEIPKDLIWQQNNQDLAI